MRELPESKTLDTVGRSCFGTRYLGEFVYLGRLLVHRLGFEYDVGLLLSLHAFLNKHFLWR
jgi:hypothetical protein